MGTGSFPRVESGWGVTPTPHPLLVSRFKNRVQLYLFSPLMAFMAYKKGEICLPSVIFVIEVKLCINIKND
jgi:hypothetical protein